MYAKMNSYDSMKDEDEDEGDEDEDEGEDDDDDSTKYFLTIE